MGGGFYPFAEDTIRQIGRIEVSFFINYYNLDYSTLSLIHNL